jgi:hypothetical protein
MKNKIIVILGLIVIVGIIVFLGYSASQRTANPTGTSTVQNSYKSEQYGFEVSYPDSWTVTENTQIPSISIHKKSDPAGLSYGIHSNTTGVTIYPKGLGTEGPLSTTQQSSITFAGATTTLTDFLLKDGQLWAELVSVKNGPVAKGWNEFALIWAGLEVKDSKVVCVDKGVEKPVESCDMGVEFANVHYVRSGTTNVADGQVLEQILRSFTFTN